MHLVYPPEDHQDWTARVLSSAAIPDSSRRTILSLLWELWGEHETPHIYNQMIDQWKKSH